MNSNRKFMYKNRTQRDRGLNNFVDLMKLVRKRQRQLIFLRHVAENSNDSSSSHSRFFNIEELLQPPKKVDKPHQKNDRRMQRPRQMDLRTAFNASKANNKDAYRQMDKAVQVDKQAFEELQKVIYKQEPFERALNHPMISNHDGNKYNDYIVRSITGQDTTNEHNVNIFPHLNTTNSNVQINSVNDNHLIPPKSESIEEATRNENSSLTLQSNPTHSESTAAADNKEEALKVQSNSTDPDESATGHTIHNSTTVHHAELTLETPSNLQYCNFNNGPNKETDKDYDHYS